MHEATLLFEIQIINLLERSDFDALTPSLTDRSSLTKSKADKAKFDEFMDNPDWVIKKIWLSNAADGKIIKKHVISPRQRKKEKYRIDLYIMVFGKVLTSGREKSISCSNVIFNDGA